MAPKSIAKKNTGRRTTEEELLAKYPHVIAGTVKYDAEAQKMNAKIKTYGLNGKHDGNSRIVHTSDLFQSFFMPKVKAEFDKLPAKERKAIKAGILKTWKAAKPARASKKSAPAVAATE